MAGMACIMTGLVAYIGGGWPDCAVAAPGVSMTLPGRACALADGGIVWPCMFGGGAWYIAPACGYGMSCGPYGDASGRIIPGGPFGGGIGTHIPGGGYCETPLMTICAGIGLGVMGGAYTKVGLGELSIGDGYPGYGTRMPPGIAGGSCCGR